MNRFLKLAFIALVFVICFTACNNDDEFVPDAKVNKQSLQFSSVGGTDSITITSNTDWTIEENADWITLSKASGNSDAIVSVSVTENTVTTQRSASITLKAAGLPDITVTVTQDAFGPNATVNKQSLQFSPGGGTDSITVNANTNWTVEKNADWITLSTASGNSSDTLVLVSVAENTTAAPRSGSITVKVAGLNDITITVEQSKALETVGLYILSEGEWNNPNKGPEISYYDVKTGQVTKKFSEENGKTIGNGVNELALYGSKLYCVVTGGPEGYIEVINPETFKSIKRISVTADEKGPRSIIFHEGYAYVTTYSQSVVRLDTASLTIDKTANLSGTYTEGICLHNGNLYVCNSGQSFGNTVSIVNLASFTETGTITVPQNPASIKATASGDIYFTTASIYRGAPSNLHILNPEQKQVTKTFDVRASKLAVSNGFIYAVDFVWDDYSDHISKIDMQTKTAADISDIVDDFFMVYSVSANPLNGDIYIGNQGQDVVAFDKNGNEKFSLKTGIGYTLAVVPVIK